MIAPVVIGVLDIRGGRVVHAVRGQRNDYQALTTADGDPDPVAIARAVLATSVCRSLYVADLDALTGGERQWPVVEAVAEVCPVVYDGGFVVPDDLTACPLAVTPVIALETWASPKNVADVLIDFPRAVFSLDLWDGQVRASERWPRDPVSVARHVIDAGFRNLLVLDVAAVGSRQGLQTGALCREIAGRSGDVSVWTGGGLADDDASMQTVRDCGADVALLGTALFERAGLQVGAVIDKEVLRTKNTHRLC